MIIIVIFIIKSVIDGSTDKTNVSSIYMRILMNHVHLIVFTSTFNFNWSDLIHRLFAYVKPIAEATTLVFSIDCFYNNDSHEYINT